jgi:hypothetical protein
VLAGLLFAAEQINIILHRSQLFVCGAESNHWLLIKLSVPTRTTHLDNADVAELLAREAETKKPPTSKALRRAARLAHLWPAEAIDLIRQGQPLTELAGVGPYIADVIQRRVHDPPAIPKPTTRLMRAAVQLHEGKEGHCFLWKEICRPQSAEAVTGELFPRYDCRRERSDTIVNGFHSKSGTKG